MVHVIGICLKDLGVYCNKKMRRSKSYKSVDELMDDIYPEKKESKMSNNQKRKVDRSTLEISEGDP